MVLPGGSWRCGAWPVCWLILIVGLATPTEAGFTITDLGVLRPGQASGATGINAFGATSGSASSFLGSIAVQATAGGTFRAITMDGIPTATSSSAAAINDSGRVVGTYTDGRDGTTHAFVATNGVAADLRMVDDARSRGASTQGVAINSSGQVLGNAQLRDGSRLVYRSSGGGEVAAITLPGGSLNGSAGGINSRGTVVGSYINQVGLSRVFVADGIAATELVAANSGLGFGGNTYGVAINDGRAIAGYGDFGGASHAFFVSGAGRMVDIGVTGGFNSSIALGMNNQGQVVGSLSSNGTNAHAFIWDQGAGLFDLNGLLGAADRASWVLTSATGINDGAQIAGQGYINGQLHGFLLSPIPGSEPFLPTFAVPTPPSAWLAAAGIGLVGGWHRLRRGHTRGRATA